MKVAVMQPYFMPYIGYFQLINAVDEFIVYDNIEYTKKGWINRNRILVNGKDEFITLPVRKDSDFLHVRERFLADSWGLDRKKMLNRIRESYRKAPHFGEAYPVVEAVVLYPENNLFIFVLNSIKLVNEYIGVKTPLVVSSSIAIDHSLKAEKKVLALCKALKATEYINPIGGVELYDKGVFKNEGIELYFLKTDNVIYKQFDNEFVPFLSIIDLIMFNTKEQIKIDLDLYKLH